MNDALQCVVPASRRIDTEMRSHYVCEHHFYEILGAYYHEKHTPRTRDIEDNRPHRFGDFGDPEGTLYR